MKGKIEIVITDDSKRNVTVSFDGEKPVKVEDGSIRQAEHLIERYFKLAKERQLIDKNRAKRQAKIKKQKK